MNPIESISSVFRNYVNFSGRAQRSEFWWFTLFTFLVSVALASIAAAVPALNVLEIIFALATLLPSLAVTARRLHDTSRSAWWLILYAIALLAWIVGIFLFFIAVFGFFTVSWDPQWDNESSIAFLGVTFMTSLVFLVVGFAATILLLVLCALPGTVGPNLYGPDPLQPDGGTGGPYNNPYAPPPATGGYLSAGQTPFAPSAPDSGQRRYCSQCGLQLQPNAQFCTYCGASV